MIVDAPVKMMIEKENKQTNKKTHNHERFIC